MGPDCRLVFAEVVQLLTFNLLNNDDWYRRSALSLTKVR